MLVITRKNIIEYLKKRMPAFDTSLPVTVSQVGEGTEEEDGDGYVNYIFRVRTEKEAYVVKQGRRMARMAQTPMGLYRTRLEYDSMKIRRAIVPEYIPFLKFYDEENNLFVMEDVSDLKISRFQFNKNRMFPAFGRQCGECMARTEFYTSEYFLEKEEYRKLQCRFENTELRGIMEDGMFLDFFGCGIDRNLGKDFEAFARQVTEDSRYETERYKLRRSFMSHADALIHADMHTSNIFISEDAMKLIDMEFSFMGPFGYDLGYLTGNLLSQYCAACFREFPSEEERKTFKSYLLATIKSLYRTYFSTFEKCWNQDVKERYRGKDGLRRSIFEEVMRDSPGYASMVNWFRCVGDIPYPDFDTIREDEKRKQAQMLSLVMDWQLMFRRYQFEDVDDLIDVVLFAEKEFFLRRRGGGDV
ncbi:MAG: phosphotransferase [Eubacteriales bacterium]|nr:phosphotransferase [Eubacteriales bacterium]